MKFPSIFKNKEAKQSPKLLKSANFSSDDASDETQSLDQTKIGEVKLSERLFFEPQETSSILKESKTVNAGKSPFQGSVALVMESDDPYLDFKKSMQEIIVSQGIIVWRDWDCLEKLLAWYLRMNPNPNHGFIVGAFVDLLVGFSADTTAYYSDASSSFPSPSSPEL
ncbi:hypothetical protein ACS0TY_009634 [Phlomoides rotata]